VEAQTVANVHLAHKQGLTIVPIINKIDLPNADVAAAKRQLEEILAIPAEEAIEASAKVGNRYRGNSRGHRHTGSGAGTAGGQDAARAGV
jgi:translation elongation factor EF-4